MTKAGVLTANGGINCPKYFNVKTSTVTDGGIYTNGRISAERDGYFGANLTCVGSLYSYGYPVFGSVDRGAPHKIEFDTINGFLRPSYDGVNPGYQVDLGSSSYRFLNVYAHYSSITMSDRNSKKNIEPLDDTAFELFKHLKPVSYQMKKEGSDRIHYGYISQDVEEAMNKVGLTDIDFAGFCKDKVTEAVYDDEGKCTGYKPVLDENGNEQYRYSLRYGEFIALNTMAIQKLLHRIEVLEDTIEEMKAGA